MITGESWRTWLSEIPKALQQVAYLPIRLFGHDSVHASTRSAEYQAQSTS